MSECVGINDIGNMIYKNLVERYERQNDRLVWGNCHYIPQYEYVFDVDGCRVCDDILVFEELEDQFKGLLRMYGFDSQVNPFETVGYINVSSCPAFNILDLPPKLIKIINERYKMDFQKFKYEMIYPNKTETR